jgi:tetratricopeptide (TPR) repeat protein
MQENFRRALDAADDQADVLFGMAVIFINNGRFGEASRIFERILEMEPGNSKALFDWRNATACRASLREAIPTYNRYIDEDPDSGFAWFNLGVTFAECGRYEEAIQAGTIIR